MESRKGNDFIMDKEEDILDRIARKHSERATKALYEFFGYVGVAIVIALLVLTLRHYYGILCI